MKTTKMNTGISRFSYLNAVAPRDNGDGNPKFSVQILIPKTDTVTINNIKQCLSNVIANDKEGNNLLKGISSPKHPLHDGDGEKPNGGLYDEVCHGHYVMNASSRYKPGLVDINNSILPEEQEWYSGIYGRANINFYAYVNSGNKGIACGLNHLQKVRDGEALGGAGSATSAFDDGFNDTDSVIDDFDILN